MITNPLYYIIFVVIVIVSLTAFVAWFARLRRREHLEDWAKTANAKSIDDSLMDHVVLKDAKDFDVLNSYSVLREGSEYRICDYEHVVNELKEKMTVLETDASLPVFIAAKPLFPLKLKSAKLDFDRDELFSESFVVQGPVKRLFGPKVRKWFLDNVSDGIRSDGSRLIWYHMRVKVEEYDYLLEEFMHIKSLLEDRHKNRK